MNTTNKEMHSDIEELLPWHAAGTLSRRDSQRVEEAIKKRLKNVYDIMVHIEPEGNVTDFIEDVSKRLDRIHFVPLRAYKC